MPGQWDVFEDIRTYPVPGLVWNGSAWIRMEGGLFTSVYDYDGSSNLIYSGTALAGSAKASPAWQIKKYTYSGSNLTDVQFADGNTQFDNIWNNRTSLSYS